MIKPARPKQRHLECFLAIVREGAIGAAADRLNLTQPALSRTLADLEDILGTRLMERSRAGIVLTPAGEVFMRYASASISALDQAIDQVALVRTDQRRAINVGTLPNVAATMLPRSVRAFKERYRDIPVRIVTGTNRELTQLLRLGEVDFIIGRLAASEDMAGLSFEPLFQEELVAVARMGHPLLDLEAPEAIADAFASLTVILPPKGTIIRDAAEQIILSVGARLPTEVIETTSVTFGRAYLMMSDALWIAPRGVVAADVAAQTMGFLRVETSSTVGLVGITTRRGYRLSELAALLAKELRGCADA